MLCVCVSRRCITLGEAHEPTLLGIEPSSRSTSIARWDGLFRAIAILAIVLLVLVALVWVIRDLRHVHHTGFDQDEAALETESSPLLSTVSSSTTLHDNYQSCRSLATTAVHTPARSLRGSTRPVLQPVCTDTILGEYGDYVTSPVHAENMSSLFESLTTVVAQPLDSATRGRAPAVTQKAESISFSHLDQAQDNPRSSKVSRTQTQQVSPSITPPVPTNEARSQTAPCKTLVKSLTGLVAIQQVTVHVLAIGMSWEGIAGGSRALPGPLHDIEWLRNLFSLQKNFRFNSLLDHAATLTTIRQSLEDMLSAAGEDDLLVLYFSGHGGHNDSFELYDSTSLTEVMLNDWIVQFRTAALRNSSAYIIFDFCAPDHVKPNTELASGVNVIWACSPTESALDLRLNDPNNHLPRSCFLLSLTLAIDDVSEEPTAQVIQRFTTRMKEFVQLIRGIRCFNARCWLPWYCCRCDVCSKGKLCIHNMHAGDLPFQVVCVGGIENNSNLPAVVKYIADHFPLHVKRAANRVSNNYWVLYFNPSRISAHKRPLNPRNHRLGMNIEVEANVVRNMTTPVKFVKF